jgi:hypothetical protein
MALGWFCYKSIPMRATATGALRDVLDMKLRPWRGVLGATKTRVPLRRRPGGAALYLSLVNSIPQRSGGGQLTGASIQL